jgi:hypothetical protein
MRKGDGQSALLSPSAHRLMDARRGWLVGIAVDEANGTAERVPALRRLDDVRRRRVRCWPPTLGADGGYPAGPLRSELAADPQPWLAHCPEAARAARQTKVLPPPARLPVIHRRSTCRRILRGPSPRPRPAVARNAG